MRAALAASVLAVALTGACNPTLTAQSLPPPGRSARMDAVTGFWGNTRWYRLELTEGVAFALTCEHGGPCEQLVATSDNAAIAEVRPAALSKLEADPMGRQNQAPASAVVIVGKQPGTTIVRLRTKDGGRDVRVTIVPPPAIGTPATVASPSASRAP